MYLGRLASRLASGQQLQLPLKKQQQLQQRCLGYWWGHDTLEDQEKRNRLGEETRVIRWSNKTSSGQPQEQQQTATDLTTDVRQEVFYAPARIQQEIDCLSSGYSAERFNMSDYFSVVRYPWLAKYKDPAFYYSESAVKAYQELVKTQTFIKERLIALGPDLSAAHFLCHRGCRVRFRGKQPPDADPDDTETCFVTHENAQELLPDQYEPGWYVEEIDASHSSLVYEGFQNLRNLIHLKRLDLSYSPLVDVWCIDRVCGEFQDSLEHLDISGCRALNWNAIESLWRFRKLRTLVLHDMDHIKDLRLLCLMLLDVFPDLNIKGVDYANPDLLVGTSEEHLLHEMDELLLIPPPSGSGGERHPDRGSATGRQGVGEADDEDDSVEIRLDDGQRPS